MLRNTADEESPQERVEKLIEGAFANHQPPVNSVFFQDKPTHPDREYESEYEQVTEFLAGVTWRDLAANEDPWLPYGATISFLSTEDLAYYLPAFLLKTMAPTESNLGEQVEELVVMTCFYDKHRAPYYDQHRDLRDLLSKAERQAVIAWLGYKMRDIPLIAVDRPHDQMFLEGLLDALEELRNGIQYWAGFQHPKVVYDR